MAFYLVECRSGLDVYADGFAVECDFQGEVWQDMSERRPGAPYPPCPECKSVSLDRIFTPPTVHGADTSRAPGAEYSHALSEGADPIYVKDRRAWKELLRAQGLKPAEDGESEAARKSHMARVDAAQKSAVDEAMDAALRVAGAAGEAGLKRELERVAPRASEDTPCLSKAA